MARPRIKQFAGDMGISYDEAKGLIKKGRDRSDGGAQILERNMKKMERGGAQVGGMTVEEVMKVIEDDTRLADVPRNREPERKFKQPDPYRQPPKSKAEQRFESGSRLKGRLAKEVKSPERFDGRGGVPERRRGSGVVKRKMTKAMGGTVYAESGKYMSCRGMGAAIQGNKFTGVK
tara:strand:+ start:222 stop:749 length:528 start_codon:yes stop_codon:yes gene_type:complete